MQTLGEKAEQALRVVREADIIAYDTETSGVDWKRNNPVGYVITATDFNCYIPVRHGGGGNLLDPHCGPLTAPDDKIVVHEFERELAKAFLDRRANGGLTVGHNLLFDMHMSANAGIYLGRNCGDTQHNLAMLDEYSKSFSLAAAAEVEGVTPKKGDMLYEHMSRVLGIPLDPKRPANIMEHFWRLSGSDPMAIEYSEGDGTTTLEVWLSQMKQIEAEEMSFIQGVESKLIWTVFRMARRGIKVDASYIEQLQATIAEELIAARTKLPNGFNERSGPQVLKLFEEAGITGWPKTEKGGPSFPEKWLKTNELGRAIIDIRQLSNLGNTFITPLVERHIWNGRVHAQLNQLKSDEYGTVSGRFSCSDPNWQAIPKRNKKIGRRFRRLAVADEGMEFYEADYKQCEPVLFTHYSKEPALVAGYNAIPPVDMHHVVAGMFNVERDPTAKRMNMGILTGMQPASFAGHMGWDLEHATNMHRAWFDGFPAIRDFQDRAKKVFKERGYVVTLLGRRCRLDHPRFAYRGTSRIIQGGNADIIKERLLRCDEYLESEGDQSHLLMTVHDSLNWQAPLGELGERQSKALIDICTDMQVPPFNLRVPLGMDVGKGKNWAEATYGPE